MNMEVDHRGYRICGALFYTGHIGGEKKEKKKNKTTTAQQGKEIKYKVT